MSYLLTGLAGCSVGPGISRGARKLARTSRVIKKENTHTHTQRHNATKQQENVAVLVVVKLFL